MILWVVVVGFIIGFALAFSIGANDVANSFGTSVGSRVLTLRKAFILASIFEMAGAILVGGKVSSTISKGIVDVSLYNEEPYLLQLGYLSSLIGASIWLLTATIFKLPVSGTHSIVGAVIGFTLVAKGTEGVSWFTFLMIVASWFISPVGSGAISSGFYFLMQYTILRRPTHMLQLERGILLLPLIYASTFAINSFSVFHNGPKLLYFHKIPWWGAILASLGVGIVSAILARWLIGPRLKRHIMHRRPTLLNLCEAANSKEASKKNPTITTSQLSVNNEPQPHVACGESVASLALTDGAKTPNNRLLGANFFIQSDEAGQKMLLDNGNLGASLSPSVSSLYLTNPFPVNVAEQPYHKSSSVDKGERNNIQTESQPESPGEEIEYPGIFQLFAFLQILTACFGAFAHGGNDVSNAIGPVIGLYSIYIDRQVIATSEPQLWILAIGGVGIAVGLWSLGKRVIQTVGTELSEVTPPSGFCIELGAATTVLIASQVKMPVSTTHCKIGSVVFVGLSRGGLGQIDWRVFRNIILAWLVTVPASGLVSAGIMLFLKHVVYEPVPWTFLYSNATNSSIAETIITNVTTPAIVNNEKYFL